MDRYFSSQEYDLCSAVLEMLSLSSSSSFLVVCCHLGNLIHSGRGAKEVECLVKCRVNSRNERRIVAVLCVRPMVSDWGLRVWPGKRAQFTF